MLIIEHTVETTATPSMIWNIWKDVENWKTWDHGIEYSHLDGPFQKGVTGTLKPKGGPEVKTILTSVEHLKGFSDEAKLPLSKIIVSHEMSVSKGKTLVTHRIEMKGFLSFFFAFVIGREMKKNLPKEMMSMIKLAET